MTGLRITLYQWRALLAVVDEGGYARAAEVLHKSQSSVTYAVQQIESQLGVKAFEIEGRKASLTPTGDMLYRRARYLLDEAMGLEQSVKRLSAGWEAEIRVAADVIFPTWILLECLDRLGKESPHTRVELLESARSHTLAQGLADLAIFPGIPSGFLGDLLIRPHLMFVAHPDHPLHKLGRKLTMRDLHAHRQLVVRESSPERVSALSMEPTQCWTVSHLATSIKAVCLGYGFAWLPAEQIRKELETGTLKPLLLREGGERYPELYLIFADREHAGPATLRLAEIIREVVAKEYERSPLTV